MLLEMGDHGWGLLAQLARFCIAKMQGHLLFQIMIHKRLTEQADQMTGAAFGQVIANAQLDGMRYPHCHPVTRSAPLA